MLVVGLSGGIGAGKSTVARMLSERGAVVVDADAIARRVLEPGQPGFDPVVARFGSEVVGPDGAIDRAALAALVFTDQVALAALNGIVHPLVAAETQQRVMAAPPGSVVVVDVPLLVEAARGGYGAVVIVEAPAADRLRRLEGRGMSAADARRRMGAQASDEQRRAVADVVLDNGGDEAHLGAQVDALWNELSRRPAGWVRGDGGNAPAGPVRAGPDPAA